MGFQFMQCLFLTVHLGTWRFFCSKRIRGNRQPSNAIHKRSVLHQAGGRKLTLLCRFKASIVFCHPPPRKAPKLCGSLPFLSQVAAPPGYGLAPSAPARPGQRPQRHSQAQQHRKQTTDANDELLDQKCQVPELAKAPVLSR